MLRAAEVEMEDVATVAIAQFERTVGSLARGATGRGSFDEALKGVGIRPLVHIPPPPPVEGDDVPDITYNHIREPTAAPASPPPPPGGWALFSQNGCARGGARAGVARAAPGCARAAAGSPVPQCQRYGYGAAAARPGAPTRGRG